MAGKTVGSCGLFVLNGYRSLDMETLKIARPRMGLRRRRGLGEAEQGHLVVRGLGEALGSNSGCPNPREEELVS